MQPNRTEYNTDPHGKYALLVSAAANIDIRVICEAESWNGKLEELARYQLRTSLEIGDLGSVLSPPERNDIPLITGSVLARALR